MSDLTVGSRILVVDDDSALCETIARRLRRDGHHVTTAHDAYAALAHCELGRSPFDLVITDVHMPGMNGLELATALIERRPTQRIVIITSDPDEALRRAALARGPVSFLLKPFEHRALSGAVADALAARRHMLTPPPAAQRAYREAAIGTVPPEWLVWADERASAGPGHGDRVARMARIIALALPQPMSSFALADLEVAAWSHEIGLLGGPTASPVDLAWRSAEILKECGSNDLVITLVRHMHEQWDGSGGPERLRGESIPLGAQILSAVDSLDHYCEAWLSAGIAPALAAERALDLVVAQGETAFNPEITTIINAQREALERICAIARRERIFDLSERPAGELPRNVQSNTEAFAP